MIWVNVVSLVQEMHVPVLPWKYLGWQTAHNGPVLPVEQFELCCSLGKHVFFPGHFMKGLE